MAGNRENPQNALAQGRKLGRNKKGAPGQLQDEDWKRQPVSGGAQNRIIRMPLACIKVTNYPPSVRTPESIIRVWTLFRSFESHIGIKQAQKSKKCPNQ